MAQENMNLQTLGYAVLSLGAAVVAGFATGTIGVAVAATAANVGANIFSNHFDQKVTSKLLSGYTHPNQLNHDLEKAFRESLLQAVKYLKTFYQEHPFNDKAEKQAGLDLLTDLEKWFKDSSKQNRPLLSENEMMGGFKGSSPLLLDDILKVWEGSVGASFVVFVHQNLEKCLKLAFNEQLKNTPRAWIAYQKLLLDTTRELLVENKITQDKILETVSSIENKLIENSASNAPSLPKELTLNLPKTQPDEIVGRADLLEELFHLLNHQKKAVVVNGMGGIGKTTIASAYLTQFYEEYNHIVWITQNPNSNLIADFTTTAGLIENLQIDPQLFPKPEDLFAEMLRRLKALPDKPNLLIIDNAENEALRKQLNALPAQPNWHLLTTAREKLDGFTEKMIDFLSESDALVLFNKHYSLPQLSETDKKTLLHAIGYHTLTIEVLAKTAQKQRYSANKLLHALHQDLRANVTTHHSHLENIDRAMTYLCSIFSLSGIQEQELWALMQFGCLPNDWHNYDLLRDLCTAPDSEEEDFFAETLTTLADKGWLLYSTATDSFKMHPIIAEVVKHEQADRFTQHTVKHLLQTLTDKLNLDQNKDNPIDKFVWIPFGITLAAQFEQIETPEIMRLQNNLGLRLSDAGNFAGAKELFEKAVKSAEINFGIDHPDTADLYSNLAMSLRDLGDYQGAKELLVNAVQIIESNFGKDHPMTARYNSNLALVLQALGDYQSAKDLFEKVMLSCETNFGKDHPSTAFSYSSLGVVLQELGNYQEAKALLEKAVKSDEKNFGKDHPTTAASYSSLALVLQDLGDYQGAKDMLEKAMWSDEKNFGKDHPSTAARYINLACVLQFLGDYHGAKYLFEKAIVSNETNLGKDHPTTACTYSNLAVVLQTLGDYQGAKELFEKSMRSNEVNLGKDHPFTARSYSNLATVLKDLGNYHDAKDLLEKAIRSDESNFGKDHPITSFRYTNLATVLQSLGDFQGAKELLERVKQYYESSLGKDHPNTARSYVNLALVLKDLGDFNGAKDLLVKATESDEHNLGKDHPKTASDYSNLAKVLRDLGDYQGAMELLEKAIKSDETNFGENHPTSAVRYINYATVLCDTNNLPLALTFAQKALGVFKQTLPSEHTHIAHAQKWVNEIQQKLS